jgi:hypothetical protein
MGTAIVPIVEGFAEVESVPVLLRRLLERFENYHVQIARPFRVKRNKVMREGELERAVKHAVMDRKNAGAILVLLDADDDCPAEIGPLLLKRAEKVTGLPVIVALAQKEFEGWLLGAKESIRGKRGIREDAVAPEQPEAVRGAKERLSRNMVSGRRYIEVDDQAALAQEMDLDMAEKRCKSFKRFADKVNMLVSKMK